MSVCTNLDGSEPDWKHDWKHGKHGPFLVMREMTAFLSVRSVLIQMSACVGKSYFVEDLNCDIRLLTSFVWHLDSTDRWWPQSLSWSTTSKQTQNQTTKKHSNWCTCGLGAEFSHSNIWFETVFPISLKLSQTNHVKLFQVEIYELSLNQIYKPNG